MEIRQATSVEDAKIVAEIYRNEVGKFGDSVESKTMEADRVLKAVSKEFEELGENRVVFLGFENNEPIATVQLLLKRADNDPELADGKDIAHVHHLRVSYSYHKSGLGKQMMGQAERYATEHGFKRVTLGVDDWNENAIGFYQHLGYKTLKEAEGRTSDEKLIYMYKDLRD